MGKTFRYHPDDGDYDNAPRVSKKVLKRQRKERRRKDAQMETNLKPERDPYHERSERT